MEKPTQNLWFFGGVGGYSMCGAKILWSQGNKTFKTTPTQNQRCTTTLSSNTQVIIAGGLKNW